VTQPESLFARNSGEHWAGRLYVRRYSVYVTRRLLPTRVTPNAVTWAMTAVGLAAAAVLTLPGVLPALAAALLIQGQILLDCVDGELARWRRQFSPAGIYLDRLAHYVTETALPIALGIRAEEPELGLVVAVLVLLIKGESALVTVARADAGLTPAADTKAVAAPRGGLLRTARRALGRLPFYRAFVAMEFTLLALAAAVVDAATGTLDGSRALLIALIPVAAVTVVGHLVAILASDRLR
jgi:phosphatidylglycerophosphate synthase